ncbi:MAG TPA: class I SAM-dependent methyltransferase [Steroidobacteraceae bacterium]|nr:class I SAM-dependent methyltransferase [Steroidobacteraceae bacterium]
MKRVPEPELMDEVEQARAYALADFDEPNRRFVEYFEATYPELRAGTVLDLGCGPGDIVLRLATRHPGLVVHGLDGSAAMLHFACERLHETPALGGRVQFVEGILPGAALPLAEYDAVISNSLLHHLHEPRHFWAAVRDAGRPGAPVLVMDLFRPESEQAAWAIVERYSGNERDLLKRDFFASLCAAFSPDEIRAQLDEGGLGGLEVRTVSDRHVLVTGRLPAR